MSKFIDLGYSPVVKAKRTPTRLFSNSDDVESSYEEEEDNEEDASTSSDGYEDDERPSAAEIRRREEMMARWRSYIEPSIASTPADSFLITRELLNQYSNGLREFTYADIAPPPIQDNGD